MAERKQRTRRGSKAPAPEATPVHGDARLRYLRVSPRKTRLVIDLIRGRKVGEALHTLHFSKKRVARDVEKLLLSAVANARSKARDQQRTVDADDLVVSQAFVNGGPVMKRFEFRARGRICRILKRTAHIHLTVSEPAEAAARAQ